MKRLTLSEAAARLGVPLRTVYFWVHSGKLPAEREVREIEITRKETRLVWTVVEEDLWKIKTSSNG